MALIDSAILARHDDILTRLRNNDPDALRELMEQYYTPLVKFAVVYAGTKDAAEDAVQSVFIRLWERRADLPRALALRSYMYSAVHHRAISLYRQHVTAQRYQERAVGETWDEATYAENSGVAQVELDELTAQLAREIASLPPRCQEVFRLSREQQLSYQEIADVLGITVSTVRMQIIKALRILRQDLRDWGH